MTTRRAIRATTDAATELSRLYEVFDRKAVDLTDKYLRAQLAGKEGVTWEVFPRSGLLSRPTPFLANILRSRGAILLGAGYNMYWEILHAYHLTKATRPITIDKAAAITTEVITIRRTGAGFDPGEKYAIVGEQVLKAGYDHHGSTPTVGSDGKLAWSAPRNWTNDSFTTLTQVDPKLQKVIERLRSYESAK